MGCLAKKWVEIINDGSHLLCGKIVLKQCAPGAYNPFTYSSGKASGGGSRLRRKGKDDEKHYNKRYRRYYFFNQCFFHISISKKQG